MRSASRRIAVLPLAVLFWCTASAVADLTGTVDYLIQTSALRGAKVAVSVVEAGPGESIVALRADEVMIPASNLKLVTSGAALHALGPDFRFRTRLLVSGEKLIVVGDGDPGFGDPRLLELMAPAPGAPPGMTVEKFLSLWTDAVLDAGIRNVGEVVVDDSVFDREYTHPGWPRDQLNRRYCAQASGLAFHLNTVDYFPVPRPGERPSFGLFEPRNGAVVTANRATSRQGVHDGNTIWIARKIGTNDLTFYGNVKHAYRVPVSVAVHDMPTLFGSIFAERLREAGLAVGPVRLTEPAEVPSQGTPLGPVIETPISTVIARCNRDSQNLYAECLLKRMGFAMTGQPGSWLNGAAIVRLIVHERLDSARLSSTVRIDDGSGLSRGNGLSPAALTAWLNSFHNDERLGAAYLESLAVGGESGTLAKRSRLATTAVHGAVVQAKSGYINGVSCLSGYVTAPDGRRRCFSIMINDLRDPVRLAKRLQDRIVAAVAEDWVLAEQQLGSD